MVMHRKIWRIASRLGVLILTLTLTLGGAQAARPHASTVQLVVWAGGYTPSRMVPATAANANAPKIKGIDPVVAAYEKLHPNVTIKLINQPIADARTWMI